MKIYLSARYGRRLELVNYATTLSALGHTVTSRWLSPAPVVDDGVHLPGTLNDSEQFAREDLYDIQAADAFVLFAEQPGAANRGGRFVEFGYALAMDKRLLVCGPRETVFQCLSHVEHCDTFGEVIARLQEVPFAA